MVDVRVVVAGGLLAVAVGLVGVGWAVRRLAGPVFTHELTVLARRAQQPRLRVGLVVVLLAGLLLTYVQFFGWEAVTGATPTMDPRRGRFAERFALTVLAVQLLAVVVLTPAVVGSAVTEERDRGTLDLLRTTGLSDREIVVGKLLARLAVVAGVVAAGLPVLALTLLFGGVNPRLLLTVYAVTAGTAFGLGAASLYLGTVLDGLRQVLTTAYGAVGLLTALGGCLWLAPGPGGLSPFSLLAVTLARDEPVFLRTPLAGYWWVSHIVFGLLYGGGGLWCVWLAVGRVRGTGIRRTDLLPIETRRWFYVRPPADDADPLLWREREYVNQRLGVEFRYGCGALLLFVVGAGLFVGFARAAESGVWVAGAVRTVALPTLAGAAVVLPLLLGLRLAGAVAGERERQTLDALLMLPGDRRQVLRAKLTAALSWTSWPTGLAAAMAVGSVLVGGLAAVQAGAAALQVVAACGFAVGLAGWLSVRQPTAARATVWLLVWLLLQHVGPLLLNPFAGLSALASPAVATWTSAAGSGYPAPALAVAGAYAAAGWVLWWGAERRLEIAG